MRTLDSKKPSRKSSKALAITIALFSLIALLVVTAGVDDQFVNLYSYASSELEDQKEDIGITLTNHISQIASNSENNLEKETSNIEEQLIISESENGKELELRKQNVLSPSKVHLPAESEVAPAVLQNDPSYTVTNTNPNTNPNSNGGNQDMPSSSSSFSPARGFQEILTTSPAVLFIRSSNKDSLGLKNMLNTEYTFSPEVIVVDLDKHTYGDRIQEYIRRNKLETYKSNYEEASQSPDVPYLFINGVSMINKSLKEDIMKQHIDGNLITKFREISDGKVSVSKVDTPSNS
ncbi:pheromone-regulated membrane protein 4 [Kluyveromyces marxianus]|uniref:Pheromone-regulated membrane protein 4 n=1 Tax=Kluyveromyces marxianus (strain DMKU3-1042 / BCC 29191 / NBRC 104275) TaxID=1003335 RepID=W0TGF7_KLUMD|nr:pheromone-regulated membrane protein 4 [Kluyveromyces marxianus DMKU3-1042]BAO41871.1 pheromone-regulated membrane protein 4 [Kluyveromyces marxianus DMKU3-1042]BAP73300.1 pheromone-regulated membrane protein 4 [Kluyveromyces marxianus]